jgi:hypothetical protein
MRIALDAIKVGRASSRRAERAFMETGVDLGAQTPDTAGLFLFDRAQMLERARALKDQYASASPFPHIVIDDFLPTDVAEQVLRAFPPIDDPVWLDWRRRDVVHQPKKQGVGHADRMDGVSPVIHHVLFALNSSPMVRFLEELTGIDGLTPDPHFVGGGLHQILPGGRLAIHSDFNIHPSSRLYRRLNVLLYLNKDWRPEYGGELQLWDRSMQAMTRDVAPIFNRCVVFNTDRDSFHGHPDPLRTPEGLTRKSLALYYYTLNCASSDEAERATDWQLRPGEVETATV